MKPYLLCPTCESDDIVKNGTTRRGKQNYKCRDCGRQFVENPQWKPKSTDSKAMIDRLLLEKIPLAGMARVMQISEAWLQGYVNGFYQGVPQRVEVTTKSQQRLSVLS
jgi:transposase-like protein